MRRRDLLRLIGGSLTLGALATRAAAAGAADTGTAPERTSYRPPGGARLVLVELAGANDGLNTVVPWRDDRYRAARPTLALGAERLVALDDEFALHAALAPLMDANEHGELAVVHGLGYPRPNRSHFRSTALRGRAGDGISDSRRRGWATHAIEHGLAARGSDLDGVSLAGSAGPLASEEGRWLSLESLSQLMRPAAVPAAAAAIDNPHVQRMGERIRALDATLVRLRDKLERAPAIEPLPGAELGEQLRQVLRFIAAGVDVPIYRVRLGGFDTHERQDERHAERLAVLGAALAAFRERTIAMGEWRSTVLMSDSEFGRRLAENGSGGTDHGAAAPQFVLGGWVRGGLFGRAPDLDAAALLDGDPVHTMDYRALYDRVLGGALGVGDAHLEGFRDGRLERMFG